MSEPVVEVHVRALAAASGGCAVFLGNEQKVFLMLVDRDAGAAIAMFMQRAPKERPLTHDLIANALRGLGAKIERVLISGLKQEAYLARLIVSAENEVQPKKLIELEAQPSDGIALALQQPAPICVSPEVWEQVEDVTAVLQSLQKEGAQPEEGGQEDAS